MRVCQFRHFGTVDYRLATDGSPNSYFTGCVLAVKLRPTSRYDHLTAIVTADL